ncbi:MAG: DUF481 domain-containing protein [Bacteroidota bacterium]
MKWIFCAAFCLIFVFSKAQLVNTEKLRKKQKEDGLSGEVRINGSFLKNTVPIYRLSYFGRLELRKGTNRFMLFTNLNFSEADGTNFVNNGYTHLRYNKNLGEAVTLEVFSQAQYNQIQKIRGRFLQGIGPRFRLVENDSTRFFVGVLYMYEHEEISEGAEFNRHHRMSSYLTVGYAFSKIFSVDHITYYQPRIDFLDDYRIVTETILGFKVSKHLSFQASFNLLYDSSPPDSKGVPRSIFSISNGLSYTF